jgi:hypothetical protein
VGPKLKIGSGGVHEDVPRVPNGDGTYTALLGDPRNDENVMIAGLHCAHILFYNRVLDELEGLDLSGFPTSQHDQGTAYDRFLQARQVTQWHYQLAVSQRASASDRRLADGRRRAQERQPLL